MNSAPVLRLHDASADCEPGTQSNAEPRRIAVAGASGFVGRAVVKRLAERHHVVGLRRRASAESVEPSREGRVTTRPYDLRSIAATEDALRGCEVALYLVHSMNPARGLSGGGFEDRDLLLADNFGRAAKAAGVQRIIYLGGLTPQVTSDALSRHLRSRREVEVALSSSGVPVTAVRAGLIVGPGGSSLDLLVKLVDRLPAMLCPRWTRSPTQPIALEDVVSILVYCCENPATAGEVCPVGGPEVMSYREMMERTARVLGRKRPMIRVPVVTPELSALWVSLITGTPRSLVRPLVESLRHPTVATDCWLQEQMQLPGKSFEESLREATMVKEPNHGPCAYSVQRMLLGPNWTLAKAADAYLGWLEHFTRGLIRVTPDEQGGNAIRLRGIKRPLLCLSNPQPVESGQRIVFRVRGGLLDASRAAEGTLEFRRSPDGRFLLAILNDFHPRLPGWLYRVTQAPLHAAIMKAFERLLRRPWTARWA